MLNVVSKLGLIRECFPKSWVRKLPLLLAHSDTVVDDGRIVAMCSTFGKRIVLLCVANDHRRRGLAGTLIKRSRGTHTYTYEANKGALDLWLKNGFRLEKTVNSPFGRRHILVRDGTSFRS